MRILVTGALGFVGRHVVSEIEQGGHTPILSDAKPSNGVSHPVHGVDITDGDALSELVRSTRPRACIHLAGIAFVPMGWTDPRLVFSVNAEGTVNLLEAFREHAPDARVLIVSSAEIYGRPNQPRVIKEDTAPAPDNPYALSKMVADLTALLYAKRYAMHVMTARPQNHIGPGQSTDFVISSFARQLLDMRAGKTEPVLRTGNLESERDFTDVRDVARAYLLLIERGRRAEAYNIATGRSVRIRTILDQLCPIVGVQPTVEIDRERYRPTDRTPPIDVSKINRDAGWEARIPLTDTLHDIVGDLTPTGAEQKGSPKNA